MARKRSDRIALFDAFRKAMLAFLSMNAMPAEWKARKSTLSHRIASQLAAVLPSYTVDIDTLGADILVWKDSRILMAIFWSKDYLTEKEKNKAQEFHKSHTPDLTLAFTLLEDKDYLLIYRFEKDFLEYLHIYKDDFSETLLKRSMADDSMDEGQLEFDIRRKPRRKKKQQPAEEPKETETEN